MPSVDVIVVENQVRVKLGGLFCKEEAACLSDAFYNYVEQGYVDFLIDFSDVDYVDRYGQYMLLDMQTAMRERRGHFAVLGVKGLVKDLFEFTGLALVLEKK